MKYKYFLPAVCVLLCVVLIFVISNTNDHARMSSETAHQVEILKFVNQTYNETRKQDEQHSIASTNHSRDVWDICGLLRFPTDIDNARAYVEDLELSETCLDALEDVVLSINPYEKHNHSRFGKGHEFSLIVLDNPMTYERVFADPSGDLSRITDALAKPECRLEEESDRQNLRDSCNADAFINYATIYKICYKSNDTTQSGHFLYQYQSQLQYEQPVMPINEMWKGYLERRWVDEQCLKFGPELELTIENHPTLFKQVVSYSVLNHSTAFNERDQLRIDDPERASRLDTSDFYSSLLILGAEFGDEAAGLTWEGRRRGIFSSILNNEPWTKMRLGHEPGEERVRQALELVVTLAKREVNFDWEWLVRHVCTTHLQDDTANLEQHSCRSLINNVASELALDFGQEAHAIDEARDSYSVEDIHVMRDEALRKLAAGELVLKNDIQLQIFALDQFQQVAMELGMYE